MIVSYQIVELIFFKKNEFKTILNNELNKNFEWIYYLYG